MVSRQDLLAQLADIQAQLDDIQEWEIGQEVYTSKGLAKVIRFYTEDDVEKIQVEMTQLDNDMVTLLDHKFLMSMPPSAFRQIIKDHQIDIKQREVIAANDAMKADFIEFQKWKASQRQNTDSADQSEGNS